MGTHTGKNQFKALLLGVITLVSYGISSGTDASNTDNYKRIAHAKKLMGGKYYSHSVIRDAENIKDITVFVQGMTSQLLPQTYQKKSKTIATAIIRESEKYGFDPIFVVALIQNESRFNPEMRGAHGEIGLMQIKPTTADWLAGHKVFNKKNRLKFKNGAEASLLNPVENIKVGLAYMSQLRDSFDGESRLYISAYNMGAKKVRDLVNEGKNPKDYVQAVMKRYIAMYSAFMHESEDQVAISKIAMTKILDVTRSVASE